METSQKQTINSPDAALSSREKYFHDLAEARGSIGHLADITTHGSATSTVEELSAPQEELEEETAEAAEEQPSQLEETVVEDTTEIPTLVEEPVEQPNPEIFTIEATDGTSLRELEEINAARRRREQEEALSNASS